MRTSKFSAMRNELSVEAYEYVLEMARLFANGVNGKYGKNSTLYYEELVNKGIEGLIKAIDNYDEDNTTKAQFVTFMHRCVKNAMINEKFRFNLHELDVQETDDNTDIFEKFGGTMFLRDDNMEDVLKKIILKHTKNNERNAEIVELHIGINCEPVELKELAKMYSLSHESVRLVCKNTLKKIREDKTAREILYAFID